MIFENNKKIIRVHFPKLKETMWVNLISIHKNNKLAIGITQNTSFCKYKDNNEPVIKWGDIILIKEIKSNEIPKFIRKVSGVPNDKNWSQI